MARKFDLTPYQTTNLVELADLTSDLHRTRWLHPADWLGQVINTPKRELDGRNERCVCGGGVAKWVKVGREKRIKFGYKVRRK